MYTLKNLNFHVESPQTFETGMTFLSSTRLLSVVSIQDNVISIKKVFISITLVLESYFLTLSFPRFLVRMFVTDCHVHSF